MMKNNLEHVNHWVEGRYSFSHQRSWEGLEIPCHCHLRLEVYIYLSGNVQYIIEGKTYKLKYGDILIANYDDLHHPIIEQGKPYERVVLNIYPELITRWKMQANQQLDRCFLNASQQKYQLIRLGTDQFARVMGLVQGIKKELGSPFFGSDILIENKIIEILVRLNRYYVEHSTEQDLQSITYNEKIDNIVKYINENLDKDLTLDHLSQKFYISKYYLLSEFKRYTGFTVRTFIIKKRLMYAKILLSGNMALQDVVYHCGFNDYSNFMRSFKKEFGITPTKYKERTMIKS